MKTCTMCAETKPLDEFRRNPRSKGGRQASCKTCRNAKEREWYAANPEYYRRRHLRRTYGITLEQYHELLAAQKGRCAICATGEPMGNGNVFHVDHCHSTGEIRGLLCNNCNVGIGALGDSVERVAAALAYLQR